MIRLRVLALAAAVTMAPALADAESRFSVNRAGGVDATGSNTDGRLSGYDSRSFSELASLNTPTVDLTPIQNQITNLENQINTNITSMSDLADRVSTNEGGISSNASGISGAYSAANQAKTRADSAYSRAQTAYTKASSVESTASSAYSTANNAYDVATNPNFTTSSRTYGGACASYHYTLTKFYLHGEYVFQVRNDKSENCGAGGF